MKKNKDSASEFEKAIAKKARADNKAKYVLRLYVAGMTSKSRDAIENITRICEQNLKGRYDLEVIDVYQQPDLAKTEQIVAAPTLIKKLPLPLRRYIGNLAEKEKILLSLNIVPKKKK